MRELNERQLCAIRDKITELRRLQAAQEELTANYAAGSTDCPMLDALRGL